MAPRFLIPDRDCTLYTPGLYRVQSVILAGLFLAAISFSQGADSGPLLTFDNSPMGTEEKPLVFRSYFPNPDLEPEVLKRHGKGNPTPRYSAKTGLLSDERMDQAIPGIPAAIGVNAGKTLSYVWDTTECRLLYAWVNGFLDMEAYWGEPTRGSRKSNDYVPRLYGQLFYKATGANPLRVNGENLPEDLKYLYHSRKSTHPEFTYQAGADRTISTMVTPGESAQTAIVSFRSSNATDKLSYEAPNTAFEILENNPGSLKVLLRPNAAETFTGFKKQEVKITEANAKAGEELYQMFGCAACHTTDGSRNHGPTFQGLSGSVRKFGDDEITADSDYLRESIREPNAKHVPEYPVGMMPAYPLSEVQIDSLVLYIQTLK